MNKTQIIIAILALSLALPSGFSQAQAKSPTPSKTIAKEIVADFPALTAGGILGGTNKTLWLKAGQPYQTPAYNPQMDFNFIALSWEGGCDINIKARLLEKTGWSDYFPVEIDEDSPEINSCFTEPVILDQAQAIQYQLRSQETVSLRNYKMTFINSLEGPIPTNLLAGALPETNGKPRIISRAEWGADESLRLWDESRPEPVLKKVASDFYEKYASELVIDKVVEKTEDDKTLTWALQYPPAVKKIILHHTATTAQIDNPAAAIRGIYYWHAITKGWGDIGYNFLVDQDGNVYEGRAGGAKVVGAHAGGSNIGSTGISILGDYQNNMPPVKAVTATKKMINYLADIYNIDIAGQSSWRGDNDEYNIIGHRDIDYTLCPGDNLYAYMDVLRGLADNPNLPAPKKPQTEIGLPFEINSPTTFKISPSGKTTVSLKLKNQTKLPWESSTKLVYLDTTPNIKVGSDIQMDRPTVNPGEQATFRIPVQTENAMWAMSFAMHLKINGGDITPFPIIFVAEVEQTKSFTLAEPFNRQIGLMSDAQHSFTVKLKNTGNIIWQRDTTKIKTSRKDGRKSIFAIYDGGTTFGYLQEDLVMPEETGTFKLDIKSPALSGNYLPEYFTVASRDQYLSDNGLYFQVNIQEPYLHAKVINDGKPQGKLVGLNPQTAQIILQNDSNFPWRSSEIQLKAEQGDLLITFATLKEKEVPVGQNATFQIDFYSPPKGGFYTQTFTLEDKFGNVFKLPLTWSVQTADSDFGLELMEQSPNMVLEVGKPYVLKASFNYHGQAKPQANILTFEPAEIYANLQPESVIYQDKDVFNFLLRLTPTTVKGPTQIKFYPATKKFGRITAEPVIWQIQIK